MEIQVQIPYSIIFDEFYSEDKEILLSISKKARIGVYSTRTVRLEFFFDYLLEVLNKRKENLKIQVIAKNFLQKPFLDQNEIIFDYLIKNSNQNIYDIIHIASFLGFTLSSLNQSIKSLDNDDKEKFNLLTLLVNKPDFLIIKNLYEFIDIENQILLLNLCEKLAIGFLLISDDIVSIQHFCDPYYITEEIKNFSFEVDHKMSTNIYYKHDAYLNVYFFKNNIYKLFYKYFFRKKISLNGLFKNDTLPNYKILCNQIYFIDSRELKKEFHYIELLNEKKFQPLKVSILSFQKIKGIYFYEDIEAFFHRYANIRHLTKTQLILFKFFFEDDKILKQNYDDLSLNEKFIIHFLLSIYKGDDYIFLYDLTKYLRFDFINKLIYVLKNQVATILFIDTNLTFVKNLNPRIIVSENSKIKIKKFKRYLEDKTNNLIYETKENKMNMIIEFINKKSKNLKRKNGHTHFKNILDSSDVPHVKKGILLFFNKDYQKVRKEIRRLKQELMLMETILNELRRSKEELFLYIQEKGIKTPENWEKIMKLEQQLLLLDQKYQELSKKIKELEEGNQ